jgi:hypothetical protein
VYGGLVSFLPPPPRVSPPVKRKLQLKTPPLFETPLLERPSGDRFERRVHNFEPVIERLEAATGELA